MLNVALTIRQPWAWAVVYVGKDIENRDWPTTQRGDFLVHAAKGMTIAEYIEFREFYEGTIRKAHPHLPTCPARLEFQLGGIIGQARLVDCVRQHPSPWFFGKYGFVLDKVKPLPFLPLRGQLGFFKVSPEDGA
jgi:hypothetical protein